MARLSYLADLLRSKKILLPLFFVSFAVLAAVIPVDTTIKGDLTVTGLTASKALQTDANKKLQSSAVTTTELGYVSGVTSAIQTQLGLKAPLASPTFTGTITTPLTLSRVVVTDASSQLAASTVTSATLAFLDIGSSLTTLLAAKAPSASPTFTGTTTFSGLTASTVPYLDASKVLTSSAVTPTELGYVSGVTSAIQTQMNTKAPTASPTFTGTVTIPTIAAAAGTALGLTSLGINDSGATSSLYLKVANNSTPGLTIKNLGSQSGDPFQILNSSGTALFEWNSNNQFLFYNNVGTNGVQANMDLRPTVQTTSAAPSGTARYSMFVGDPAALAAGIGGGIALGFGTNANKDQSPAGYIWVTKNNLTAGDVGSHMLLATENNTSGKAQKALELDDSGNSILYGNEQMKGSSSGIVTIATQAAAGTYEFDLPTTAGSSGQYLTSGGGAGAAMTWSSPGAGTTASLPGEVSNCSIAASVATHALTVALKDSGGSDPSSGSPCKINFRSATATTGTYTEVSTTAAASVVISNGSALGCTASVACTLYVYAINNAGTAELGVIGLSTLDEGSVQSSTAEGGAGAADSANTLYSTTSRSSKAVRLLARIAITPAAAFAWDNAATELSNRPFDDRVSYGFTASHGNDCAFTRTSTSYGDTAADATCTFNHSDHNMGTAVASYVVTNNMPGVTFTPPKAGLWEVCFTAAYAPSANSAAIELYDGTTEYCKMGNGNTNKIPATCCAQINLASTSSVNWWLRTLNETSGTATIGANGNNGNAINWNVKWLGY